MMPSHTKFNYDSMLGGAKFMFKKELQIESFEELM